MLIRLLLLCCLLALINSDLSAQQFSSPPVTKETYQRLVAAQIDYRKAVEKGDSVKIALNSYILAKRYAELNDSINGHRFFSEALRIRKSANDITELGKINIRLGEWSLHRNELSDAWQYFHNALFYFKKVNNPSRQIHIKLNLARLHQTGWFLQKKMPSIFSLDSAFFYYQEASQEAYKHKLVQVEGEVQLFTALAHLQNNDAHQAILFLKKSLNCYIQEKDTAKELEISSRLAMCYIRLGKLDHALTHLLQAQNLDATTNLPAVPKGHLMRGWMEYYLYKGDPKKLAYYQNEYFTLKIQELDLYLNSMSEGARLLYQSEQKEAQLQVLKHKLDSWQDSRNRQKQRSLIIFIALSLVGSIAAGVVYYRLFVKYKILSRQNAALVKEQSHRIKNNLQSVSDFLTLQLYKISDPTAIQALEESLTRIHAMLVIHRRLYNGEKQEVIELKSFIPELVNHVLRSYELEFVDVDYCLSDTSLPTDEAITLALLVNELTTNVCKHAFGYNENPQLKVTFTQTNHYFHLTFWDNGPGLTHNPEKGSFGLDLVDLLTKKLHGSVDFFNHDGCCFTVSFKNKTGNDINKKTPQSAQKITPML